MENAIQIKFLYLRDFFQNKFPNSNYFVIKWYTLTLEILEYVRRTQEPKVIILRNSSIKILSCGQHVTLKTRKCKSFQFSLNATQGMASALL